MVYDTIMIIYGTRYENETKNKIQRMIKENYKTIYSFKGNKKTNWNSKIFIWLFYE